MKRKGHKKEYFKKAQQESNKTNILREGLTGFLVTCEANAEKRAIKECFNMINSTMELVYPDLIDKIADIVQASKSEKQLNLSNKRQKTDKGDDDKEEEKEPEPNIETQSKPHQSFTMEDEIEQLRANNTRIWFNFEVDAPGVIFIKMHESMKTYIDVHQISEHMFASEESCLQARFAYRFLPISVGCKASGNMDEFKRLVSPLIKSFISARRQETMNKNAKEGLELEMSYFTWCMEFKQRGNAKIKQHEYLTIMKQLFRAEADLPDKSNIQVDFSIDLKDADFDVVIEVFRDLMLFSIVKQYKQRKKYNCKMIQEKMGKT